MFMLRNVGKYIFGDSSKQDLIHLDQGQLYIVRPHSVKGYSECIFKDAAATIRRTSSEYHYQLVIQRAFEDGEEQLVDDAEDADEAKDDKTFLLDESLHLRFAVRNGRAIFAWRDLSGDPGDLFEFECGAAVQSSAVQMFELVAMQCQFERKFRRSHESATEQELHHFSFSESPIPSASPVAGSPAISTIDPALPISSEVPRNEADIVHATEQNSAVPTQARRAPEDFREVLAEESAELHLFDPLSGSFILQDLLVTAGVFEVASWQYVLQVNGGETLWIVQAVIADINPVFNFEYLSFIFNHYRDDGTACSWLLRFKDLETEERFQEGLMRALWEQLNEQKWLKAKEQDRDYVLEAFQDLTMEDAPGNGEGEEESDHDEVNEDSDSFTCDIDRNEARLPGSDEDGHENSNLAIGFKHDRSFVVRGSKIGVFKHLPDNNLEFAATISKVQTPKGRMFEPSKVMLHAEDSALILKDDKDPNSLFRMDLEYGKVVDEWKVHDDIPINLFAPEKKFSQMTGEQTFLGLSRNALYRVDPRLSGNKLVDSQLKQYVSKNDFSAAATTESGYIAVASNKGDIRLFDRLGINAKTHLPALGESIIGLDVSKDGRWVLATCKTYLLLIDALQTTGKSEGKLGFEKAFGKDTKPKPRRLTLSPSHVAQMQAETKASLSFTVAKFNTGLDADETAIITSTGPFMVTWNLKRVVANKKDQYQIKRYSEEVKSDNFRFGSDKNVIVALPNEVNMVGRQAFKKPTRESIAAPRRVLRTRSGAVDSP